MENEVSKGVWIGVALLGITAVLMIILWIFSSSKDTANSGSVDANEQLKTLGDSAFTDFDQKIVTGQQVIGAIKTFEDKPYAIIIGTAKTQDIKSTSSDLHTDAVTQNVKPFDGSAPKKAVNYNAVLQDITEGPTNGVYKTTKGIKIDAKNELVYDVQTENVNKKGFHEYVSPTTKFRANIIRNAEGDYAGIVLVQKSNK